LIWRDDEKMSFSVKSAYNSLKKEVRGDDRALFERFWKVKSLTFAQVIAWRVLQNSIATKDNLLRRGVILVSSLCGLCSEKENVSHLFF